MLEVLQKKVEDVSLPLNEKVLKGLDLRLGNQSLHNLVEVPARYGLKLVLCKEVKKSLYDLVVEG